MEQNNQQVTPLDQNAAPEPVLAPGQMQPVPVTQQSAIPEKPKSKFSKKLILIIAGVLLLLVIAGIVLIFIFKGNGGVAGILPIPMASSSPTATATAAPTSPYVNDPDVLKIEEDLRTLDGKLNSTDLREDTLRVPVLEWEVEFD